MKPAMIGARPWESRIQNAVLSTALDYLDSPVRFPLFILQTPCSLPTDLTTAVLRETRLGRSISTSGLNTFLSGLLVLRSATGTQ